MTRKLRVFLCHASEDKPAVRKLYKQLAAEAWIEPWLDEENLLPGQDFDVEIYKATRDADAIVICLSKVSVVKEGYVNKEIRRAYDIAQEKPEGAIYVIPLRLDECEPSFEYLKKLHWVDYYKPKAHEKLTKALERRANTLEIEITENKIKPFPIGAGARNRIPHVKNKEPITRIAFPWLPNSTNVDLDLYRFIQIPATEEVPYSFYIGKYPVTNSQYERFLNAPDFANQVYWLEFSKFDSNCKPINNWERIGVDWLKEQLEESKSKLLLPLYWDHKDLGIANPNHPVVGISWYEASAYSEWLFQNWDTLSESKANSSLKPQAIRLTLENEWATAAGGEIPLGRYPWDEAGIATTLLKEKLRRSNIGESGIGHTTPVNAYPLGRSPFGVMDMAGNVWEWQANYYDQDKLGLRGGFWGGNDTYARVAMHDGSLPPSRYDCVGFRVTLLPNK